MRPSSGQHSFAKSALAPVPLRAVGTLFRYLEVCPRLELPKLGRCAVEIALVSRSGYSRWWILSNRSAAPGLFNVCKFDRNF